MIIKTVHLTEANTWKIFSFFTLDSKPYGVNVSLTGTADAFGSNEVRIYIEQLVRVYGFPPESSELFVVRIDHEFGTMFKAALKVPKNIEGDNSIWLYLNDLEKGIKKWDTISLKRLIQLGHPLYKK